MNAYFIRFPEYRGGVKFKPIDEFPGYWIGETERWCLRGAETPMC